MNDSIYAKVGNRSGYSTMTRTELWLPLGSRHCLEGAQKGFWENRNSLDLDSGGSCTSVYFHQNSPNRTFKICALTCIVHLI